MDQAAWNRIAAAFAAALDLPPERRAAYLEQACPEPSLRAEVLAMLAAEEPSGALRVEERLLFHASEPAGLTPGTRIGPYRIESLIGRGGMGEVYRAIRADDAFEQEVAIKLLRPDGAGGDLARRFRTERTLLARLAHPNIATILDGGTAPDGRPYLVLRLVDGRPITDFAAGLSIAERLRLMVKVARAVQFAHTRLVIHRDLKPSNILVPADGEPILLDFGIAKLLDDTDGGLATQTGQRLLTPAHAAPEQLRGDPITTATDVYGLGTLLFEVLTGRRVHEDQGGSPGRLEAAILDLPAPAPSEVAPAAMAPALRGDLDRIVQMALRKEPERRYGSADQFADDLERYLAGRPVLAQPDTWGYRVRRFAGRNRIGLAVAAAFAILVAGAVWREFQSGQRVAEERDRALRQQAAAEEALRFVTTLFRQSDPRVVPGGDTLRVGAFLSLAESQVAALADQPEQQLRVLQVLGAVRANRGDYAPAESLLTLARDLGRKHLGPERAEVLETELLLGGVVKERRGAAATAPLFTTLVERARRALDPGHPGLPTYYTALASTVEAPDSVRTLLDSAVALRSRHPGGDSTEIASALDDQARERSLRGRYAEAEALDRAALRILLRRYPPDHPYCLTVTGNLATWLGFLGRWEESAALATEVLEAAKRQRTGGEGLGLAYERAALQAVNVAGRQAWADSVLVEALRVFRATLSADHGLITNSLRNLAIVRGSGGRVAEGLALMDSATARARAAGEVDNAAYLTGQQVPLLVRLGRAEQAVRAAATAASIVARLPRGSTRATDIDYWAGLAAVAAGRPAEAIPALRRAEAELRDRTPDGHPRLGQFRCLLGVALARQGGGGEAVAWLDRGCGRMAGWGLADPTVAGWGKSERDRLGHAAGAR